MIYGIYKNVRNAAWQCLVDNNITSLPVDLMKIANTAGIKVLKNSEASLLAGNESGICVYAGDTWYVVYDDEATSGRRRMIIAHELGHIFLGHERGRLEISPTKAKRAEEEADAFAARLLAPSCVLWGLDIHLAEEIETLCNISKAESKKRAERMKILYNRQKFLTDPLEQKLFEQFRGFIGEKR